MKFVILFILPFTLFAKDYKKTLGGFYVISKGDFTEKVKQTKTTLKSTQNSPITLGLAGSLIPVNKDYFYSYSVYLSHLRSGKTSLGEEVNPPLEYGLTGYYNKIVKDWYVIPYAGIDYERFSTFNTDEASVNGTTLKTREHQIIYATLGAQKAFTIDNISFYAKASLSYSVSSSSNVQSTLSDENFTGYKYMFFLNFKISGPYSFQMLYKRHIMDGPTELTIDRFAVGLGYKVF